MISLQELLGEEINVVEELLASQDNQRIKDTMLGSLDMTAQLSKGEKEKTLQLCNIYQNEFKEAFEASEDLEYIQNLARSLGITTAHSEGDTASRILCELYQTPELKELYDSFENKNSAAIMLSNISRITRHLEYESLVSKTIGLINKYNEDTEFVKKLVERFDTISLKTKKRNGHVFATTISLLNKYEDKEMLGELIDEIGIFSGYGTTDVSHLFSVVRALACYESSDLESPDLITNLASTVRSAAAITKGNFRINDLCKIYERELRGLSQIYKDDSIIKAFAEGFKNVAITPKISEWSMGHLYEVYRNNFQEIYDTYDISLASSLAINLADSIRQVTNNRIINDVKIAENLRNIYTSDEFKEITGDRKLTEDLAKELVRVNYYFKLVNMPLEEIKTYIQAFKGNSKKIMNISEYVSADKSNQSEVMHGVLTINMIRAHKEGILNEYLTQVEEEISSINNKDYILRSEMKETVSEVLI